LHAFLRLVRHSCFL